jgi:shikimate dehydrogenase
MIKEVYTLADLKNWEPVRQEAGTSPIRFGVLGDPVARSLSPEIQNAALKDCQINFQYARFQIRDEELSEAIQCIRRLDFIGANLTVPHKIKAAPLMDQLDPEAKSVGAVNTIKIENDQMTGFNTDGRGFSRAIREEFSVDLRDLRILLLGAGGAARAIARQCAKENCERLVIANRTLKTAEELTTTLRNFFAGPRVLGPVARLQAIGWEESAFRFQIGNIDLIVNATPLGLNPSDHSPIPARLLAPHLMIFDTIYVDERTPFVSAGMQAGARTANGLSMLIHQGALAFELWFNRPAPIEAMRRIAQSA